VVEECQNDVHYRCRCVGNIFYYSDSGVRRVQLFKMQIIIKRTNRRLPPCFAVVLAAVAIAGSSSA